MAISIIDGWDMCSDRSNKPGAMLSNVIFTGSPVITMFKQIQEKHVTNCPIRDHRNRD